MALGTRMVNKLNKAQFIPGTHLFVGNEFKNLKQCSGFLSLQLLLFLYGFYSDRLDHLERFYTGKYSL